MQQFAAVDETSVYQPLQGFTAPDLGYAHSGSVSNLVTRVDDPDVTARYVELFDRIWGDDDRVSDVTAAVRDHIAAVYAENSPARLYFLILYNLFAEFLEDVSDDTLPNELTGYRDSAIWKRLFAFQRDAATGAINKLETFNGCVLADSVGLGKTFTALAVIKYYELRNKSVLVLAPKKLTDNWRTYNANLTTNIFAQDRFNYDVLAHTDLSRTSGESMGVRLEQVNWGNYDLVVIDESHAFRNAGVSADDGKETRYERLLHKVVRAGVRTKVLMLSATPVNNRFSDLRNQLALAYEGESQQLSEKLDLSTSVEEVFRRAQAAFNDWSALSADERTTDAILDRLDFDFFALLDAVTIARSRRHIQAFYDTSEVGVFPERLPPISERPALSDRQAVPTFHQLVEQLEQLTLGLYTPMAYVFPSRLGTYEERYGNVRAGQNAAGGAVSNLGQASRERGIRKLMTVNLLKRLESSVEAFRLTLGRLQEKVDARLAEVSSYEAGGTSVLTARFDDDPDPDDEDLEGLAALVTDTKVPIALADMDLQSWRRDLELDRAIIDRLLAETAAATPKHDLKLQRLIRCIEGKVAAPLNPGNRKVLVFSAFADTATYLYRELVPRLQVAGLHVALVTGQGGPRTTAATGLDLQQVLTLFSPRSKSRDLVMPEDEREIDVLIATDCISEGQNLQDCDFLVNYDIHWNPVRIVQRFGRVDRIGSDNSRVQLVNFWPDVSLDEYINLKERVEKRMVIADLTATADDNVLTQESSDAAFRRNQLRKLQTEVLELEETRTGVSITDLGLNDFRMDLLGYVEQHGDLAAAPKGMHAVVPADPAGGLPPGAIFVLRSLRSSAGAARGNRLHPHFLVYVDDDGNVIADQSETKRLLDLVRAGCRAHEQPIIELCREFNDATADGAEMLHYSTLLTSAIRGIADVAVDRDVDSLFTPGATTALTDQVVGLEDFELVGFLAIIEPVDAG